MLGALLSNGKVLSHLHHGGALAQLLQRLGEWSAFAAPLARFLPSNPPRSHSNSPRPQTNRVHTGGASSRNLHASAGSQGLELDAPAGGGSGGAAGGGAAAGGGHDAPPQQQPSSPRRQPLLRCAQLQLSSKIAPGGLQPSAASAAAAVAAPSAFGGWRAFASAAAVSFLPFPPTPLASHSPLPFQPAHFHI
jgi:hypothetical protein